MEILIAILIAAAIAHGGTARGRDAARDGFHSLRNAARALRGRGGPGAKDRLLNDYRDGRAFLGARAYQQPVSKTRPDAVGVSKGQLLAAAGWRGYKGGWTGEAARRRAEVTEPDEKGTPVDNELLRDVTRSVGNRRFNADHDRSMARLGIGPEEDEPRRATNKTSPPTGASPTIPTRTPGGPPVTIATATGGEILSYPQLLAELDSIVAEAGAELEDRQAAKKRAEDDVARIDIMLASLGRLELDRESLGKLLAIGETNGLKVKLANEAAVNAEHRHALAVDAKATVVRKHAMLQEAHMAAGRDAAQKQFYQGG